MSRGLSKEDTKQTHPLQAILLCDSWGEDERWGPLVPRANDDGDGYDSDEHNVQSGDGLGETRPWVSHFSDVEFIFESSFTIPGGSTSERERIG
jgi:hypothetical protein